VIVEGVLKADVLYAIHPGLNIVATPYVTANHGALAELTHGRPVLMAFDEDFYSNETVCFHLAALIARRLRRERALATTRIASWDARVKGIDDAAVRTLPITSISVQRWLDRLIRAGAIAKRSTGSFRMALIRKSQSTRRLMEF
jgi:hypothetical protein